MNRLAQGIIGEIDAPIGVKRFGAGDLQAGSSQFLGNIVKTLIAAAGLYALFNLIFAGYAFMSAGGEPKKIEQAWAKIYQTMLGLAITAGSFVLAAIFGQILFGDPTALLRLQVFGVAP